MRHNTAPRHTVRILVAVAVVGGALSLSACQTPTESTQPTVAPTVAPQSDPVDQTRIDEYAGRPADRVEEDIQRRIRNGELPSSDCQRYTLVEHPDGGYHLVCTVPAPE